MCSNLLIWIFGLNKCSFWVWATFSLGILWTTPTGTILIDLHNVVVVLCNVSVLIGAWSLTNSCKLAALSKHIYLRSAIDCFILNYKVLSLDTLKWKGLPLVWSLYSDFDAVLVLSFNLFSLNSNLNPKLYPKPNLWEEEKMNF